MSKINPLRAIAVLLLVPGLIWSWAGWREEAFCLHMDHYILQLLQLLYVSLAGMLFFAPDYLAEYSRMRKRRESEKPERHKGLGDGSLPEIFGCFLFYSVIGWIYEVLVFTFELREGFVNRGFLFGPWLPVYGFGALLILALCSRFRSKNLRIGSIRITPLLLFFGIIVLATGTELAASYLMEAFMGRFLWDYSADGLNFQGRIAVRSSIRFGLIGIGCLYGIQPRLEKLNRHLKKERPVLRYYLFLIFGFVFSMDLVFHLFMGSHS